MGTEQSRGLHKGGQIHIEVNDLQVFAGQCLKGTIYINNKTLFQASTLSMHLIGHEQTKFSMS
jgi:hypothetical protein